MALTPTPEAFSRALLLACVQTRKRGRRGPKRPEEKNASRVDRTLDLVITSDTHYHCAIEAFGCERLGIGKYILYTKAVPAFRSALRHIACATTPSAADTSCASLLKEALVLDIVQSEVKCGSPRWPCRSEQEVGPSMQCSPAKSVQRRRGRCMRSCSCKSAPSRRAKMVKRDEARLGKSARAMDAPGREFCSPFLSSFFLPPHLELLATQTRETLAIQEQLTLYSSLSRSDPTPALAPCLLAAWLTYTRCAA